MYQRVCAGLLTAVVLLVIGCNQSPVAPTPTPTTGSTSATSVSAVIGGANVTYGMQSQDVPFSGVVAGEVAFNSNPRPCEAGFTPITAATGQASHLGLTSWYSSHCLVNGTEIAGGVLVLTAANGDKVYATYTGSGGSFPPEIGGLITVTGTIVFSGGTGRFKNASGAAELNASVVFEGYTDPSWAGRWEWNGTIRY